MHDLNLNSEINRTVISTLKFFILIIIIINKHHNHRLIIKAFQ